MEIKIGRVTCAHWRACYFEDKNLCVVKYNFGSDMMTSSEYYEITKELFDKLSTPDCNNEKAVDLIKKSRLLYSFSDGRWGGPMSKCYDENWQNLCDWSF